MSYTKETTETAAEYKDLIDQLIRIPLIRIEIIGSFVWVSGDTKPVKDELKRLGMRYHPDKIMWYKSPPGYRKRSRNKVDIETIRSMYGSEEVKNRPNPALA